MTKVSRFRWSWLFARFAFWVLIFRAATLRSLERALLDAGWTPPMADDLAERQVVESERPGYSEMRRRSVPVGEWLP